MHKKLIEKMKERSSKEDLMCLADIADMALDTMKESNHEFYEHLESLMYETVYGKVISEEMAEDWVSKLKPMAKWTKEEIANAISGTGLKPLEAYVVMNMLYSDMKNVLGTGDDEDSLKKYIQATKDWLSDEDASENKLYNYYKYIIKK